jgi:acyl-CoA synthetase (NDP forming)
VTNGGSPGIICAHACEANGVPLPEPATEIKTELGRFLVPSASLDNPVDMIASASADDYRQTVQTLVDAGAYDAIIVIFVPALTTVADDVAAAISEVAQTAGECTIAAVFMTGEGSPERLSAAPVAVPGFAFPEDAARAVALAARHGRWRARPPGRFITPPGCRVDEAAAIISRALADGSSWLEPSRVAALLDCYGLPVVTSRTVADAEGAVDAARQLGRPVALKAIAPGLLHKSDAGAVRLDLDGPAAVRAGALEIQAAVASAGRTLDGLLVQPMAADGVEMIIGVVHDHSFGPVLACGAGGTSAELIKDVAVAITPVSDLDAAEMLRSLKTFPLLDGYRGAPRCDLTAIEDVLLRVGAMVQAHPEVAEMDCNPLIATPQGAIIVDARIRVEPAAPPPPVPSVLA